MSGDNPSDESDSIARRDVLDSAGQPTSKRRGVLRGTVGAAAAARGVSGTAAADAGTQDTFCTYQCIDGTCGCRKYYIDHTFNTCYDYSEWCCTDCTSCEDDCPYS